MKKNSIAAKLVLAGAGAAAAGAAAGAAVLISKTLPRPKETSEDIIDEFADAEKMKEYEKKMAPQAEWAKEQNFEDVYIESNDGLKLHALYLKAKGESDKCAIISHGFTSKAMDGAVHAQFFHDEGYAVLMPDLRAHGQSEGKYVGFGILDRFDTELWVKWVKENLGDKEKIVLHGVSMGATTSLMALGVPYVQKNVSAVIADCAFTSPEEIFSHVMKKDYHLPAFPFMNIGAVYSKQLAGYKFNDYSTREALKDNKVPVLFIHGAEDKFVPTRMSQENYEAAGDCKKDILIVENAGHGSSAFENTELYKETERKFLDEVMCEEHGEKPGEKTGEEPGEKPVEKPSEEK